MQYNVFLELAMCHLQSWPGLALLAQQGFVGATMCIVGKLLHLGGC